MMFLLGMLLILLALFSVWNHLDFLCLLYTSDAADDL